jgi:hypothetical protein
LSFAAITLCVAYQLVIPKVSVYLFIYSVWKLLDTLSYVFLQIRPAASLHESKVKVKVKVKVKLSLCLTKHHAMKTYWGV